MARIKEVDCNFPEGRYGNYRFAAGEHVFTSVG